MQIPLSLPGASASLTSVVQGDRLPPLVSLDPQRRQCTISASDVVLHLRVRAPGDLAKAARLLGPSPALAGQPLSLHLLLVLLERVAAIDDGTAMVAEILAAQANLEESIPDEQPAPPASPAEIRAAARHAIEQGMLALEGRWNIARGLIAMGEQLWRLRGEAAHIVALTDGYHRPSEALLTGSAALVAPLVAPTLPLPLSDRARTGSPKALVLARHDAWLDWISCAPGPDPLPGAFFSSGLGLSGEGLPDNRNQELSLPHERAELLRSVAASLLRETAARPAPRYLHQVLRIAIPRRLRQLLVPWRVTGIRVIPHVGGMYVAVEAGSAATPAAVAWWPADGRYGLLAPKAFAPALWLLIHVIAAAFWRDLHAAAIALEAAPLEGSGAAQPTDTPRLQRGTRSVVLPPARRPHGSQPHEQLARWSSPEEEAAIEHYARQDGRYRALPRGWEEREQHADFQRRRQAAIGRAQTEGYPEPEPGFTFVRPHERRGAQPSPNHVGPLGASV